MSIAWGPAIDAEVSYRQQRVRADFPRTPRRHFFFHHHHTEPEVAAATALPLQKTAQSAARQHAA